MSAGRSVTLRLSYVDHGSPLTPYWTASLEADDDWHGACGGRASGPAGALVLLLAYVAQNPGYWREPPWMTCEVVDAIAASRVAHTQAQRLAAMYPTTDEPTIDPRTVIDDRVTHLLNTEGEQFKARMWQQLSIRGMNDGRAHSILRKLGLTQ